MSVYSSDFAKYGCYVSRVHNITSKILLMTTLSAVHILDMRGASEISNDTIREYAQLSMRGENIGYVHPGLFPATIRSYRMRVF